MSGAAIFLMRRSSGAATHVLVVQPGGRETRGTHGQEPHVASAPRRSCSAVLQEINDPGAMRMTQQTPDPDQDPSPAPSKIPGQVPNPVRDPTPGQPVDPTIPPIRDPNT